jgi:hypothetical protein
MWTKMPAGYSGTPLSKKLGIKSGGNLVAWDAPRNYLKLLAPLPKEVTLASRLGRGTDILHVFCTKRTTLDAALSRALAKLRDDAAIWVSWPKKASKLPTDITEDTIREIALPMGLVDVKVCAVDETWSGLKLVVRKENRTKK